MLLKDFIIELGDRLKVDKLTSEGKNILTRKLNQTYIVASQKRCISPSPFLTAASASAWVLISIMAYPFSG